MTALTFTQISLDGSSSQNIQYSVSQTGFRCTIYMTARHSGLSVGKKVGLKQHALSALY